MNSAQRRKHRRKWRYTVSVFKLNPDLMQYGVMYSLANWCVKQYGRGNFKVHDDVFMFDRPERLTEFILRWS